MTAPIFVYALGWDYADENGTLGMYSTLDQALTVGKELSDPVTGSMSKDELSVSVYVLDAVTPKVINHKLDTTNRRIAFGDDLFKPVAIFDLFGGRQIDPKYAEHFQTVTQ